MLLDQGAERYSCSSIPAEPKCCTALSTTRVYTHCTNCRRGRVWVGVAVPAPTSPETQQATATSQHNTKETSDIQVQLGHCLIVGITLTHNTYHLQQSVQTLTRTSWKPQRWQPDSKGLRHANCWDASHGPAGTLDTKPTGASQRETAACTQSI